MRKKFLFIAVLTLCILGICACGKKELKKESFTENYVAYVQINPSVKLNYSRTCEKIGDAQPECEEPQVNSYELVNDDAKEIYKDIDLLAETKDLSKVIDLLCSTAKEKGIEVKDVSIQSDWVDFGQYLEETEAEAKQEQNGTETTPENEIIFNVETQSEDVITTNIQEDIQEEIKAKTEAEAKAKAEEEEKKKAEEERLAKEEAETIKLSDNVSYSHSGKGYCCKDCFSTALINSLKNAKGYAVTNATSSRIDIKFITKLTPDKYNTTTFKGSNLLSKITNAGGEECGGLGGEAEPLTAAVCREYHLKCK
jgi:hypothetical protein